MILTTDMRAALLLVGLLAVLGAWAARPADSPWEERLRLLDAGIAAARAGGADGCREALRAWEMASRLFPSDPFPGRLALAAVLRPSVDLRGREELLAAARLALRVRDRNHFRTGWVCLRLAMSEADEMRAAQWVEFARSEFRLVARNSNRDGFPDRATSLVSRLDEVLAPGAPGVRDRLWAMFASHRRAWRKG